MIVWTGVTALPTRHRYRPIRRHSSYVGNGQGLTLQSGWQFGGFGPPTRRTSTLAPLTTEPGLRSRA